MYLKEKPKSGNDSVCLTHYLSPGVILWSGSLSEVPMAPAPIFAAVMIGGIGIACAARPLRAVMFCRWYHRKKPKWVQGLPFADLVMRPWMPQYFRIMGVFFCLFALALLWIAGPPH
jgi:hypothetical protein